MKSTVPDMSKKGKHKPQSIVGILPLTTTVIRKQLKPEQFCKGGKMMSKV